MVDALLKLKENKALTIYLRILAMLYLYGAIVHYANLLGFGEIPFAQEPLSWKIADILYAILDTFTYTGLWLKKIWGIAGFLMSAFSQLVLYIGFPHWFAFNPQQQELLWSMVIFHLVTLTIFFGLLFLSKRQTVSE